MKRLIISTSIGIAALLSGCAAIDPPVNQTVSSSISAELQAAAKPSPAGSSAGKAAPESISNLLLPPVSAPAPGKGPDQRFDLVVSDAPIGQVLSGLVAGTDYSILLKAADQPPVMSTNGESKPSGTDPSARRVTLNLKNVTLYEALDSLRDLYGYDYSVTGRRILVQPESIQSRVYYINYVSGQRRGVSDLQVVGGAAMGASQSTGGTSSSAASTSGSSSTSGSYSSVQASGLSTTVKSDIWSEAEEALRTLLGCQLVKSSGGAGVTGAGTAAGSAARAGASRADVSYLGQQPVREKFSGSEGCPDGRAVNVNQMSGLVLVRGMPSELRMAERLLRSMQMNVARQVIIEAKIIDVELNSGAQQGINWGVFSQGRHRFSVGAGSGNILMNQAAPTTAPATSVTDGIITTTTAAATIIGGTNTGTGGALLTETVTLGGLLGAGLPTPAALTAGMGMAVQARNFAALINFLESQGRVHVLSSPRIATMNNQKSVIKVGSEEPYVTGVNSGTTTPIGGATTQITTDATLNYQPFFSGIALDVTPQIDADDNITLHVHSMVNNVVERQKIIALPKAGVDIQLVPFAANTINETDSVVRARDGQVIVIGGLMTESTSDNRGGVSGVRSVPGVGALFNRGQQSFTKRELVILLKPTIVKSESAWVSDITATGDRISAMESPR